MGSGCSSPLRKFGGRRGKTSRRDSSVYEGKDGDDHGALDRTPQTIASAQQLHQQKLLHQKDKCVIDNEITIQSEYDPEHPSTGSYTCTEAKTTQLDESSSIARANPCNNGSTQDGKTPTSLGPGATMLARIRGLNGNYVPHDRHLLVSPALSPAPSTCYSPTPNLAQIDLSELNEAFRCLTLGQILDDIGQQTQAIKLQTTNNSPPSGSTLTNQPCSYNTQQLVQTGSDLTNCISVILLANDTILPQTTSSKRISNLDSLVVDMEARLRSLCDEHSFSLRFLNLSQTHLSDNFHVNNILDVTMQILQNEYQQNGQRTIVIILNNIEANFNTKQSSSGENLVPDKKLLPLRIEAQIMNKLLGLVGESVVDQQTSLDERDNNNNNNKKELFKRWYNQVENVHYLRPIYLVDSRILSNSKAEHELAWQKWLDESQLMIQTIEQIQSASSDPLEGAIQLKSMFNSLIDYVTQETILLKRTLLIRNMMQQQQKDSLLNDFARLLSDSNKLALKRLLNPDELGKPIIDFVTELSGKFLDSIIENQIMHGKQVPQFMDRNLFTELTCQRQQLHSYVSNLSESFELKSDTFYTSQIEPILSGLMSGLTAMAATIHESSEAATSTADQTTMTQNPKASNHLVFISGPRGCGKSSLFSRVIKLAGQNYSTRAQLIYRFCDISADSSSPSRLLRSICEQFCQTQGENIAAASYIYSARQNIMSALNKIVKYQPTFMFIDGLDKLANQDQQQQQQASASALANCEWLCEWSSEPNLPLKIFIMLESDSKFYREAMSNFTEATFISLDNPSINEWAQMLNVNSKSRRLKSSGNIYDDIKTIDTSSGQESSQASKLTYRDVSDVISMCMIRKANNEQVYPELNFRQSQDLNRVKFEQLRQSVLTHLHYLVSPYQLCAMLVVFNLSRFGVYEIDLINIMSMISQLANLDQQQQARVIQFSLSQFELLRGQLKPWLLTTICDKRSKILANNEFVTQSIEYYVPSKFPNIVSTVREVMFDYYSRPNRSGRCSSANIKGIAGVLANKPELLVQHQQAGSKQQGAIASKGWRNRAWLACQASELSHLLVSSSAASKTCDYLTHKVQFFNQFQYGTNPEDFIEDCERLKLLALGAGRKASNLDELQVLVSYVKQSVYALRYDGSQIFSQIYCRALNENIKLSSGSNVTSKLSSKCKRLNDILGQCSSPPVASLLPISDASVKAFTETRIGISDASGGSKAGATRLATPATGSQVAGPPGGPPPANNKQRIFTIKDNCNQVIVIYPDRNCLAIWDIFEERAVRTIDKLDNPRDLRMVDSRRAVILCNRELRLYDLDTGQMVTKLKGVMNQKMPYFQVYGSDYVVALARNRMYVNMLNLNTGELETTFKVGEDRFLNSLLVSSNGGICVCGDETQKPFPLLVWNLNERRLMYDLRLERHEFLTRMSAISDDGHFVVCVCRQLGPTTGSGAAQPSPDSSSTSGSSPGFGELAGGQQQLATAANFIVIYDLTSGTMFKKWKPGVDTCAVAISYSASKSGKLVSSLTDSTILVWDLITGSKRHTLVGHSAQADCIRLHGDRLLSSNSTNRDQSLRLWDIEEGCCLAVFTPDAPVACCQLSHKGDAVVCGFVAESRLSTLAVCKQESVSDIIKRNRRRKSSKALQDSQASERRQS